MVGVKAASLAVLFLVHGAFASCDGSDAEMIIQHLNQFRSMLVNYAALGNGLTIAEAASTSRHKRAAEASTEYEQMGAAKTRSHSHVAPKAQISVATVTPTTTLSASNEKVRQKQKQQASQDPERKLHAQVRKTYRNLAKMQSKLDTMSGSCVPDTHKLQVASALTKVLSVYATQEKGLKAAGKLIDASKPPKKAKSKKNANKANSKQKREMASRLPLKDNINTNYNDPNNILDVQTSAPTPSNLNNGSDASQEHHSSPSLYRAEYITVTTTESNAPATSSKHKGGASSSKPTSADNESDSGSDSESESGDDSESESEPESSSAHVAPTTSQQQSVISRVIDGTLHLVTGTIGFALRLFGIGGKNIVENELSELVQNVAKLYEVKV